MVNTIESPGTFKGQNIRRLFDHTQNRPIASRVAADRAQLPFRKKTALATINHGFAATAYGFANLSRPRVRCLDDPKGDPFRAAGTDPRHPMKLPDQFLQGWWIFYFAHSFLTPNAHGLVRRTAFAVKVHHSFAEELIGIFNGANWKHQR